jgi:hypothetical protein
MWCLTPVRGYLSAGEERSGDLGTLLAAARRLDLLGYEGMRRLPDGGHTTSLENADHRRLDEARSSK